VLVIRANDEIGVAVEVRGELEFLVERLVADDTRGEQQGVRTRVLVVVGAVRLNLAITGHRLQRQCAQFERGAIVEGENPGENLARGIACNLAAAGADEGRDLGDEIVRIGLVEA